MELNLYHLYPDVLNLYGDRGNVLCLRQRLAWRGIDVRVTELPIGASDSLAGADLVFIGGGQDFEQEALLEDLHRGKDASLRSAVADGVPVLAICGGYQMLGRSIVDAGGVEGGGGVAGMGLLPMTTEFTAQKRRTRVTGRVLEGCDLTPLDGAALEGYEIHMGTTRLDEGARPLALLDNGAVDGCCKGAVWGSYLHGFFDTESCRAALLGMLCRRKGIDAAALTAFDYAAYKKQQYDLLADAVEQNMDLSLIERIIEEGIA